MSQRMRRNASPSTSNVTKQGPLKAVRAFSLKNSTSGSRSSDSSPTIREIKGSEKARATGKSPDHGLSSERRNQASPSLKDKGRSHFLSPVQYLPVSGCRASSADPTVPYLTGQWPKDINSYHHYHSGSVFMCDKSTQTVDSIEQVTDKKKSRSKSHSRSSSVDHGDLSKEAIKQRLQKTKEGSRAEGTKQRWSPVAGVHSALSLTAPPTVFAQSKPIIIPCTRHIPARNMTRFMRNSVEGLNMEIEKLVLSKSGTAAVSAHDVEDLMEIPKAHDIPDGRRAPPPQVNRLSCTRSVDTQTPSGQVSDDPSPLVGGVSLWEVFSQETSRSCAPYSMSGSDGWSMETSRPLTPSSRFPEAQQDSRSTSVESKSSKGDSEQGSPDPSQLMPSPRMEKSCPFVREPPDGCEKVKAMEETRSPLIKEPLFCPVKPVLAFKQSQDSAFCPLSKHYCMGETAGDLPSSLLPSSAPLSPRLC